MSYAFGKDEPGWGPGAEGLGELISVPVDIDDVLRRGGRGLLDLLEYCVLSVQLEPLFTFLVGEYRRNPTPGRSLALYDLFCAPGAPARIRADQVLPPRNLCLVRAIEPIRQERLQALKADVAKDELPVRPANPPRYVFDFIVGHLEGSADNPLQTVSRHFDPGRTPRENLPGGKLTPGQRAFLENVWRARVRPRLVAAGFARIADVGG